MLHYCYIKRTKDDPVIDRNGTRSLQDIYNDVLSGRIPSSELADKYQVQASDSDNIPPKNENMTVPLERLPGTDINIAFEHALDAKQNLADKVNSEVKSQQYEQYKHKLS